MTSCHECGTPIRQGRRCAPCHKIYFPIMEGAIAAVATAVRLGELPRLRDVDTACVDCGNRATQYEHRDYMRPLDVEPVCRKCNVARGPAEPLPPHVFERDRMAAIVDPTRQAWGMTA